MVHAMGLPSVLLVILLIVVGSCVPSQAVPITIDPANCVKDFIIGDWKPQRFGPYVICNGGTVTFRWTGLHGVFQIPSIACPSNFTSGETELYKFLTPTSNGGEYVWKTPNTTGHYWATSQFGEDCKKSMLAEIYVVSPEDAPFRGSALKLLPGASILVAVMTVLLLAAIGW